MNAALACKDKPEPKPYYGAKIKQIADMYKHYVPPHILSKYERADAGCSGHLQPATMNLLRSAAETTAAAQAEAEKATAAAPAEAAAAAEAGAAAEAAKAPAKAAKAPANKSVAKRPWDKSLDDERFWALHEKMPPQSTKEWLNIAKKMWPGCQPRQCKSAAKRLKKHRRELERAGRMTE